MKLPAPLGTAIIGKQPSWGSAIPGTSVHRLRAYGFILNALVNRPFDHGGRFIFRDWREGQFEITAIRRRGDDER